MHKDDSIEEMYDILKECGVISKLVGGLGVLVHNTHATGSYIQGTKGTSNGIVHTLHLFNDTTYIHLMNSYLYKISI